MLGIQIYREEARQRKWERGRQVRRWEPREKPSQTTKIWKFEVKISVIFIKLYMHVKKCLPVNLDTKNGCLRRVRHRGVRIAAGQLFGQFHSPPPTLNFWSKQFT